MLRGPRNNGFLEPWIVKWGDLISLTRGALSCAIARVPDNLKQLIRNGRLTFRQLYCWQVILVAQIKDIYCFKMSSGFYKLNVLFWKQSYYKGSGSYD